MNKLIIFNEPVKSVRKSQQTIHSQISRVESSLIQMIRLASLLQWTELTSKEPGDLVCARYWCCEKYVTNVEF